MIQTEKVLDLLLAGNSILTFKNKQTQKRFTFKVRQNKQKTVYFVYVLSGQNNNSDYSYMGIIDVCTLEFKRTEASKITEEALSFKGFDFIFKSLKEKKIKTNLRNLEVWHEGKCCRCGRLLTDPVSIERGLGPECCKR